MLPTLSQPIVATRVLTPIQAVALAAFFNLIGPLFFTTAIAKTIGGAGIITPGWLTIEVIIIGVLVASFWIYFTAYVGVPISSTHAMVGGLIGAAVAFGGISVVVVPGMKLFSSLIMYGVIGAGIGAGILLLLARRFQEEKFERIWVSWSILRIRIYHSNLYRTPYALNIRNFRNHPVHCYLSIPGICISIYLWLSGYQGLPEQRSQKNEWTL